MSEQQKDYGAEQITVLEGLEPVRVRPGMYIGSTTSRGMHHLVWEIVDNAVDEALAGHCSEITLVLGEDDVVTVTDNGRGIPVDKHPKTGESALDVVFTRLHAGGKFGGGGYKVSGGLHGVGASVTNALSEWLEVEVRRDGYAWTARYERGVSVQPVTRGRKLKKGEPTGTTVAWRFDQEIFDTDSEYRPTVLEQRLREKSYLVRGLTFRIQTPGRPEQTFVSKRGIADYVSELNAEREAIHPNVILLSTRDAGAEEEVGMPVEIACQWTRGSDERIYSFANVVPTSEGGTHVTGLRRALTRALNAYAYEANKLKKDKGESLEGRDIFEGLTCAIAVQVENPQFEGQTKGKLNNPEAATAVTTFAYAAITDWFANKKNAKEAKAILDRCLLARDIRIAKGKVSKKLKDQATSIFSDSNLPGKLADCLETRPVEERELFLVEGDSAGGCFTADTRVALADGSARSFAELVADWERGIVHEGYASTPAGELRIVTLEHPRRTRTDAPLVEVMLSAGEPVRCTPDHLFLGADGAWTRAAELTPGQALMSLRPAMRRAQTGSAAARAAAVVMDARADDHQVVGVRALDEVADVYDLTVAGWENFALAEAEVFVHNSAKSARDVNFQAILPLRGKIINVLTAKGSKAFDNAEVEGILTALGGRKDVIGKNVVATLEKDQLRYGKVVLLSVDADEMTLVRRVDTGEIRSVRIGPFIDRMLEARGDPSDWEVSCFDRETNEVRWRELRQVIRHVIEEPLYEIRTACGRSVRVTASHSVFVLRDGKVELARGDEIAAGDLVVAPERLPLANPDPITTIDLVRALHPHAGDVGSAIWVRGASVERVFRARDRASGPAHMHAERVALTSEHRQAIIAARKAKSFTQAVVAREVGVKQTCTVSEWETGRRHPTREQVEAYCALLEVDAGEVLAESVALPSQVERLWERHADSAQRKWRQCIRLAELTAEEVALLDDDVVLTPEKYADRAVSRHLSVSEELMFLIGFALAEGSIGNSRAGVRLAVGARNRPLVNMLNEYVTRAFGITAAHYEGAPIPGTELVAAGEVRILNTVVMAFFDMVLGLKGAKSATKRFPDLVWNVAPEQQLQFLRGCHVGDGTLRDTGAIVFGTASREMAEQLRYLLLMHGIPSGHKRVELKGSRVQSLPGRSKEIEYFRNHDQATVIVTGRDNTQALATVWQDHPRAAEMKRLLSRAVRQPPYALDVALLSDDERYTVAEIVRAVGLSDTTVRNAMDTGDLPFEIPASRQRRGRSSQGRDVRAWLASRRDRRRAGERVGGDLIGLPVVSCEEVAPTTNYVYDFSVEADENFICGSGGICCHNTDADVDGAHIANLLLTLFSEQLPQLIAEGRVFLARPPLYRINLDSRGEKFVYAYSDEERAELIKKHRRSGEDVQRFKGLGEMNPESLEETVFDPTTRSLLQVVVEDPAEATETLNLIMGSRAEPRRVWLEEVGLESESV